MARLFDDASSEYLGISSTPITGPPFTFGGWAYSDSPSNWQTTISIAANSHYFVLLLGSSNINFFVSGGGSASCTTTSGPSANTWHHVCGVAAASNDRASFIDGGSKGTSTTDLTPVSIDRLGIGVRNTGSPLWYMSGRCAEMFIYDVALTDAEVGILAAGYSPLFVRPQSLVAYWPLIRDEDQDRVGGYDMTAFNTPTIATHPPIIYPAQVHQSFAAAAAPPAGLSIPVAMHHYRQQGMSY